MTIMVDAATNRAQEDAMLIEISQRVIDFIKLSSSAVETARLGIVSRGASVTIANLAKALISAALDNEENANRDDLRSLDRQVSDFIQSQGDPTSLTDSQSFDSLNILLATNLIGIWGALESYIGDLFKAKLKHGPELLATRHFDKMSLPVKLIAGGSDELYHEIYLKSMPPGTGGFGRFEDLLNKVGLAGEVPDDVRRNLVRAHQIRNVWAHRAGVADRHFVENCPDPIVSVGENVTLTTKLYNELGQSIIDYITVIIGRLRAASEEVLASEE